MPWTSVRPALRLALWYAVGLAAWAAFAHGVVPRVIDAGYHGRFVWPINAWFAVRPDRTVDSFHAHWRAIASGILFAGPLHYFFVLYVRRVDRRRADVRLEASRWSERAVSAGFILLAAAFLLAAVRWGVQGDYGSSFLDLWAAVIHGHDPWFLWGIGVPLNAYGPLFNLLAGPAWVHELGPKLLFAFAYLLFAVWLLRDLAARRGLVRLTWWMAAIWLVNPFVWGELTYWGHFDVLVGLACVAAIHARVEGRDGRSGAWLSVGVLLKYLPVTILPFLALDGRKIRPRLVATCLAGVAAGLAVSVLLWGWSTFQPLRLVGIQTVQASIYASLAAPYSPVRSWAEQHVQWLPTPVLAAAGLVVFAVCAARRIEPAAASVTAVLVTLMFYRVGLQRYEMVIFLVASYWLIAEWPGPRDRLATRVCLISLFTWLALAELLRKTLARLIDYNVWGIVTFVVEGALLITVLTGARGTSVVSARGRRGAR